MKQSTLAHLQLGLVVIIAAIYIFLTLFVTPVHAEPLCHIRQPVPLPFNAPPTPLEQHKSRLV